MLGSSRDVPEGGTKKTGVYGSFINPSSPSTDAQDNVSLLISRNGSSLRNDDDTRIARTSSDDSNISNSDIITSSNKMISNDSHVYKRIKAISKWSLVSIICIASIALLLSATRGGSNLISTSTLKSKSNLESSSMKEVTSLAKVSSSTLRGSEEDGEPTHKPTHR